VGLIKKLPVYAESLPGGGIVATNLEAVLNFGRAKSVWYLLFGTACCAIELMCTGASRYDFDRLGMIFRASPRQADLIIAAGTITKKMAPRLRKLYDQMAEPRYVIAMGGCTVKGGPTTTVTRWRRDRPGRHTFPVARRGGIAPRRVYPPPADSETGFGVARRA
jgi:NADH-quinone oxidoreductase B subunit